MPLPKPNPQRVFEILDRMPMEDKLLVMATLMRAQPILIHEPWAQLWVKANAGMMHKMFREKPDA